MYNEFNNLDTHVPTQEELYPTIEGMTKEEYYKRQRKEFYNRLRQEYSANQKQ